MKRSLLLVLFFIIISDLVFSQDYWMQLSTPDSVSVIRTEVSPNGDILLCTNKGIYYSLDDGISWLKLGNLNASINNVEFYDDGEICSGSTQLFHSLDEGSTWNLVNPDSWMQILFVTSENELLLGNWGGISRSSDRGVTWDSVYQTGSAQVFNSFIENDGFIFSGCLDFVTAENNGIYSSIDGGISWNLTSLQGYGISQVILDVDNNILAGVTSSPMAQNIGLYKSFDNGVSWMNIFTSTQVAKIGVDSLSGIYIGLEGSLSSNWGVLYSPDAGETWQEINDGLDYANTIYDIDVTENYIYTVTLNYKDEKILYRSKNPIVGIQQNLITYRPNISVFPNPLGNKSKIFVKNSDQHDYKLDVYDQFGRNIVHGIKLAGNSTQIIQVYNCKAVLYLLNIRSKRNNYIFKVIGN
jgi:photosystem II stability/assembly factor-like uncharacterized protein